MVDGLVRLMAAEAAGMGPVNLGNPEECTMRDLAGLILRKSGATAPLVHLPLPDDDPRQRQPDIALARATLGWEPSVGLEDGIEATIDYFRHLPDREGD
jgi:UDP-glucuronate decarboxylase